MSTVLFPEGCVEWLLRSSALMAAVWLLSFMPRISAALRHGWIVTGMAAALVMPWFIVSLPSWSPGSLTRYVPVPPAPQARSMMMLSPAEPVSVAITNPVPEPAVSSIREAEAAIPKVSKPLSFVPVWIAGTALLMLRLLLAGLSWRRAVRSSERLSGCGQLDVRRTARTAAPVSGGFWHSIVLLPPCSIDWTPGRMNAVLAHEEEHIRRRDAWWLLLGHILCAVQWFNPFAWLLHRRAGVLREDACDAAAIVRGVPAPEYADALLALASPRGLSAFASPMARRSGLERRIRSVLRGAGACRPSSRPAILFSMAGLCALTFCASSLRSQEKSVPAAEPGIPADSAPKPPLATDSPAEKPVSGEIIIDAGGREFAPDNPEAAAAAAKTLDVAVKTKSLLETETLKVYLTRSSASVVSSEERARLILAHPQAILLSIQPGDFESRGCKGMAALVTKSDPGLSRSMVLAHHILTETSPGGGVRLPPVFYAGHPLLSAAAKNPAAVVLYTGKHPRDEAAWHTLVSSAVENLREAARIQENTRPSQILTNRAAGSSAGAGILATRIDDEPGVVRWSADQLDYALAAEGNVEEMKLAGSAAMQILIGEQPLLISGGSHISWSVKSASLRVEGLFEIKTAGHAFKGRSTDSIFLSDGNERIEVTGGTLLQLEP